MVENFDDRGAKRTAFTTPLQVKDLSSGEIHEAKMLDYSDGGISFASDGFFEKGTSTSGSCILRITSLLVFSNTIEDR